MLSDSPQDAEAAARFAAPPPEPVPPGSGARSTVRRGRRGGGSRRAGGSRTGRRPQLGLQGNWSIRTRILVLVLVPSLALAALWGTYTFSRFNEALDLRQTVHDVERVGIKSETAMVALQEERRLSMVYLAQPRSDRAPLDRQRENTNRALETMRRAAGPVVAKNPPDLKRIFAQIVEGLGALPGFRQQIDARQVDHGAAYQFYTAALSTGMTYFEAEARLTADAKSINEAATAVALFRALEGFARQNALLSAGLSSPSGLTADGQRQFNRLVGAQREQWAVVAPSLRDAQAERYRTIIAGPEWSALVTAEQSAMDSGRIPTPVGTWQDTMLKVAASLQQLTLAQVDFAIGFAEDRVDTLITSVIVTSVLTLAAIALAVLISVLISRALIRRLRNLRSATLHLADRQLPDVMARLQRGEEVDLADTVPDVDHGSDEVGQVASAFATAQRIAVRAAIEQTETREGISRVFLNLAHRSQGLVHRQLALLDAMERDSEDPDLLAELFRVDHLATRMRRNSENLSILGGSMPARRWRRPVGLTEILRGAASQTEEYARVQLTVIPDVTLAGPVAGDVMHLLSELVENATTFAPPHTRVQVNAEVVSKGLAIEIEDRGLGMSQEAREEANRLLAAAPAFNVMGFTRDSRIGLFVVARLAARHHLTVTLRSSPYGGTSAIVLLPTHLLEKTGKNIPNPDEVEATADAAPWRTDTSSAPAIDPPATDTPATDPRPRPVEHASASTTPLRTAAGQRPESPTSGLPRRVRQANLRPQLLHPTESEPPRPAAEPAERSADEARRMMTMYQRRSDQGRADADRGPDGGPDSGPDDVAGNSTAGEGQWDPR
ncbi:nitrate- and nitrite sensing domain-containing protein [Embleya sp. NPDC001921]